MNLIQKGKGVKTDEYKQNDINKTKATMLRKTRIALAAIFYTAITLLFLDFTGTLHTWFGWMAKIQFLPALLALNVGVVAVLILLTFLLGSGV